MIGLIIIIFILIIAFIFFVGWFGSSIIIHPPLYSRIPTPANAGIYYEDVKFKSSDGLTLKGWYVPSLTGKATIILCHGFGTNKSDLIDFVALFNRNDFNTFLFDFRGHGGSEGKCSLGFFEVRDIEGAVNWLKTQKHQTTIIGAFGISMGAAAIFMAAGKIPEIKAVAGDSIFSSFEGMVTHSTKLFYHLPKYPLSYLIVRFCEWRLKFKAKDFEVADYINKIAPKPILLIHGEEDRRIPLSETECIYQAAKIPKEIWIVPGADHLESYSFYPKEYEDRIIEYFKRISPKWSRAEDYKNINDYI